MRLGLSASEYCGDCTQLLPGPRAPSVPEGRMLAGLEDPQQHLHPAQKEQRLEVGRVVHRQRALLRVALEQRVAKLDVSWPGLEL